MSGCDLLCFGEALIDFFPEHPGSLLQDCERFVRHAGGAPTNVAIGASQLGARVRLVSAVGDDPFGIFLRRFIVEAGIVADSVLVDPNRCTGLTFVAVASDGSRRFLSARVESAIGNFHSQNLLLSWFDSVKIVHLGSATLATEPSRSATFRTVELATQVGAIVSVDLNWRPHLWPDPRAAKPLIRALLQGADLVKISDDELDPLFGTVDPVEGAAKVLALGPSVVVVTLGAKGSQLYARNQCVAQPAPNVKVVDSTGAGDGFCAGMLTSLLEALGPGHGTARQAFFALDLSALQRSTARGNEIGSHVVTAMGATTALLR